MIDPNVVNELAKAANSEQAKALTLPASQALGQLLGSVADAFRHYATSAMESVLTEWARERSRTGRTINAEDIRRVMPLLPTVSTVVDEELHIRWATLLETASDPDSEFQASFAATLTQMPPNLVRMMDHLRELAESGATDTFTDRQIDDWVLKTSFNEEWKANKDKNGPAPFNLKFYSYRDRLFRMAVKLDLLEKVTVDAIGGLSPKDIPSCHFSDYGFAFMEAITPRTEK